MMMAAVLMVGVLATAQLDPLVHVDSLTEGLDDPARISVNGTNEVLVTDPRANAVVRFDLAGNYLGTWSEPAGPIGIAVH
ncbi:MAG: hypothetical protein ACYSVY_25035, partial [Planctomycetota bacterium]